MNRHLVFLLIKFDFNAFNLGVSHLPIFFFNWSHNIADSFFLNMAIFFLLNFSGTPGSSTGNDSRRLEGIVEPGRNPMHGLLKPNKSVLPVAMDILFIKIVNAFQTIF